MMNSLIENCNSTDSLMFRAFVGTDAEKPQIALLRDYLR